jgi:hypothetical protein
MGPDDLYLEEVRRARDMSPEEKILAGPRLFGLAYELMLTGIRQQNPGCTEAEVAALARERLDLQRTREACK